MISRIIKVEVGVISRSRSRRLRLITLTESTLIILDITKTESNNCLNESFLSRFDMKCFQLVPTLSFPQVLSVFSLSHNQQTAPLPPSSTSFVFVSPCLQLFFRCLARSTTRKLSLVPFSSDETLQIGGLLSLLFLMPGNWKQLSKPFSRFQLGKFLLKICLAMFVMKNLTDFRKTEETGVDQRVRLVMKAAKHQS